MDIAERLRRDELLARPAIELVTVDADVIRQAEKLIDGCEHCHEEDADIPFDWILARVTGRSGATTDYIFTEPARCPQLQARDQREDSSRAKQEELTVWFGPFR